MEITQRGKKQSNIYIVKGDDASSATSPRSDDAGSATSDDASSASSIVKEHLKQQRESAGKADSSLGKVAKAKDFIEWFATEHLRVRHGAYVVNYGKEVKQAEQMLSVLGEDEVKRRARLFLSSNNPFYAKTGYTIGVLASSINSLGASANGPGGSLKKLSADELGYE